MLYVYVDHFLSNAKWLKWYLTLNRYINKLTYFLILSTKRYRSIYWHVKVFGYNFDSSRRHSVLKRYYCWGSRVIEIHSFKNLSWQQLSKYTHVNDLICVYFSRCCQVGFLDELYSMTRDLRQQYLLNTEYLIEESK